jgi:DNA replication licensing factor MCM2
MQAMEQQSISISKAGIVTTLQARCAVLAAANPISGRYDITKTFSENVQLTDPILTRFDILCVVRDEADPALDEKLATFVVNSHSKSHPLARAAAEAAELRNDPVVEEDGDDDGAVKPFSQALLKKYILVAKEQKPSLASINQDKLAKLYSDLRKESEISGGIPIAVRHIESMMRMAEASARIRLSPIVNDSDVTVSIRVMLESFISAQRFSVMRVLRRQFSRYLDAGVDYNHLCLVKLRDLVRERQALEFVRAATYEFDPDIVGTIEIKEADFREKARRHNIDDSKLAAFLSSKLLEDAGFTYDKVRHVVYRVA